jgi:hypothetical protein
VNRRSFAWHSARIVFPHGARLAQRLEGAIEVNAARRAREAVSASAAIAYWVGTVREIEALTAAAKRHLVASKAFAAESNMPKAYAHLDLAERLMTEVERLQAQSQPANA